MSGTIRPQLHPPAVEAAFSALRAHLVECRKKHGTEAYASVHETLGILLEEVDELMDAVRSNDTRQVLAELLDVAQVAVYGVACLHQAHPLLTEGRSA